MAGKELCDKSNFFLTMYSKCVFDIFSIKIQAIQSQV